MKCIVWDIETSNFNADFAIMLSSAFKPIGQKPYAITKGRKGNNDKELVRAVRDELEKYDLIIGYYHLGFDLMFLNSRLLYWGLKPLSRKFHIDVYRIARKVFKIHSRRLISVAEFLKIPGKTKVNAEDWMEAAYNGNPKALQHIVEHNIADVEVLEAVFDRVKCFILSISKV